MFRLDHYFKGLVIDADSFATEDLAEFKVLSDAFPCYFLTSSHSRAISIQTCGIAENRIVVYDSFLKYFTPSPVQHDRLKCLAMLKTSEIAYVSQDIVFLNNAAKSLSSTVLISDSVQYSEASSAPDFICESIDSFIQLVNEERGGFLGENVVLQGGIVGGVLALTSIRCDYDEIPLFFLGRYYDKKTQMMQLHPYSVALYRNKIEGKEYSGVFDEMFAGLYVQAIKIVKEQVKVDMVCAVPVRPGARNRFRNILQRIAVECEIENGEMDLQCRRNYPSQKGLNATERVENVNGVFECSIEVEGKTVVLIDDIVSTGATICECIRSLYSCGARHVVCVALAINQFEQVLWNASAFRVQCEVCGGEVKLLPDRNKGFYYYCVLCSRRQVFERSFQRVIEMFE